MRDITSCIGCFEINFHFKSYAPRLDASVTDLNRRLLPALTPFIWRPAGRLAGRLVRTGAPLFLTVTRAPPLRSGLIKFVIGMNGPVLAPKRVDFNGVLVIFKKEIGLRSIYFLNITKTPFNRIYPFLSQNGTLHPNNSITGMLPYLASRDSYHGYV